MMALPVMAASWQPTSAFPRNKTKRLEAKCSRAQGIGIEHDETDFPTFPTKKMSIGPS